MTLNDLRAWLPPDSCADRIPPIPEQREWDRGSFPPSSVAAVFASARVPMVTYHVWVRRRLGRRTSTISGWVYFHHVPESGASIGSDTRGGYLLLPDGTVNNGRESFGGSVGERSETGWDGQPDDSSRYLPLDEIVALLSSDQIKADGRTSPAMGSHSDYEGFAFPRTLSTEHPLMKSKAPGDGAR
jgi:hypothetical protein